MKDVKVILNASKRPFVNLGTHYGGIEIQGKNYVYIQNVDAFVRRDVMRKYKKNQKLGRSWEEFLKVIDSNG